MADSLGDRVHYARRRKGLNQTELARRMGMSNVTISRIEKGAVTDIRPDTLRALAQALGVTSDYLLGLSDDEDDTRPRRRRGVAAG